ncbi:MAG TPA: NAD(P)-binding protein [Bacteroidales bacterium]|nr:NAD(P)-binding protein [Bacteroidales bacterium]
MQTYDVVIIGSGLGGLLCGYMLGKEGLNVCIIEKNKQLGGCLQVFKRNGSIFDTGVHYIGSLDKGQILHRYFSYCGLMDKLKMKKLDANGFDLIGFRDDDKNYAFAQGHDHFLDTLLTFFPEEKQGLTLYVNKIREIAKAFPLNNLRYSEENEMDLSYFKENTRDFLRSITSNEKLQNVLAGGNFLYGGDAEKSPLYVHALITNSFIESSWRLVDGSAQLADLLAQGIISQGGTIRKNGEAQKFICKENILKYVQLSDNECIEGKYFISDIHPALTLDMLETSVIRKTYRERITTLENSLSAFILYINLKKSSFPKLNHNYYYFRDDDVWKASKYQTNDWPSQYMLLTPENSASSEYADTMIIMSYMRFDEVKRWENTSVGQRGSDYLNFKQGKAELLLDLVDQKFPGIRKHISAYHTSTPLTLRDYTGSREGSMFGVLRQSDDPYKTRVSARTRIPNLFFTGQNTIMHGILGVTIGSVATCGEIIGLKYLIERINRCQ